MVVGSSPAAHIAGSLAVDIHSADHIVLAGIHPVADHIQAAAGIHLVADHIQEGAAVPDSRPDKDYPAVAGCNCHTDQTDSALVPDLDSNS